MFLNCGVGKDSWESLGLQGDQSQRKSVLNIHWKDWCWSWNANTLATCCEELTHLKRPWCWERLKAGGEGDDRGWDGWMASPTQWTWVWASSGSWWWTEMPGVLQSMRLQRVRHDWVTELNWNNSLHSKGKISFTKPNAVISLIHSVVSTCLWRRTSGPVMTLGPRIQSCCPAQASNPTSAPQPHPQPGLSSRAQRFCSLLPLTQVLTLGEVGTVKL